jgi:hypothetical protein
MVESSVFGIRVTATRPGRAVVRTEALDADPIFRQRPVTTLTGIL